MHTTADPLLYDWSTVTVTLQNYQHSLYLATADSDQYYASPLKYKI